MFLRCKVRRKDGKQHRYWSVVENTRVAGGRVVQRHVLYLGEINDSQELAWRRPIEVLGDGAARPRTLSLFPEDRCEGLLADASIVAGRSGWELAAKGRAGIRFCSCWSPTACWRRAANGGCIVSGFSVARCLICWARMPGWPRSTNCIAVTTGCWRTSKQSSITLWRGGATCSTSATTCCCTI